ncbi:Zinc finger SWIM domain-containing protein 7 [Dispira parvispora]|uniref:Zinc finger SWIM domain-containing protein 7 n=1 Tax=Dispira parvispora TaxID=1520584 RepID=A0A9W8E2C5_9FUNG|nr:Zinc finger SWIM domain-containing protein 7 [Dispira parvispora]
MSDSLECTLLPQSHSDNPDPSLGWVEAVHPVLVFLYRDIRSTNSLTDQHLGTLLGVLGLAVVEETLDLLDNGFPVTYYVTPQGQGLYHVPSHRGRHFYTLLPRTGLCSCEAFTKTMTSGDSQQICKHLLLVYLQSALRKITTQFITLSQYLNFLMNEWVI